MPEASKPNSPRRMSTEGAMPIWLHNHLQRQFNKNCGQAPHLGTIPENPETANLNVGELLRKQPR